MQEAIVHQDGTAEAQVAQLTDALEATTLPQYLLYFLQLVNLAALAFSARLLLQITLFLASLGTSAPTWPLQSPALLVITKTRLANHLASSAQTVSLVLKQEQKSAKSVLRVTMPRQVSLPLIATLALQTRTALSLQLPLAQSVRPVPFLPIQPQDHLLACP